MRTHIIKKNAFPVYDELFEFNNLLLDNHETHSLLFTVSTYDTFTRDEVLGEVNFPLQLTVLSSTEMTFTQSLTARQQQVRSNRSSDVSFIPSRCLPALPAAARPDAPIALLSTS